MKPYQRDHHKQNFPLLDDNDDLYIPERKVVFRKKDFHKHEYSFNDDNYYDKSHQPS